MKRNPQKALTYLELTIQKKGAQEPPTPILPSPVLLDFDLTPAPLLPTFPPLYVEDSHSSPTATTNEGSPVG